MIALQLPYVSVTWPDDDQKDQNMLPLQYGKLNILLSLMATINNLFIL